MIPGLIEFSVAPRLGRIKPQVGENDMPARTHAPRNRLAYPARAYDNNDILHSHLRTKFVNTSSFVAGGMMPASRPALRHLIT